MNTQITSDDHWKKRLDAKTYHVMRERGTDIPFSGKYVTHHENGTYVCKACDQELFSSETKFDSNSGWPSFTEPKNKQFIVLKPDESHGMTRTEVLCSHCGSHLGHVFNDGPAKSSGQRFCINSTSLNFKLKEDKA